MLWCKNKESDAENRIPAGGEDGDSIQIASIMFFFRTRCRASPPLRVSRIFVLARRLRRFLKKTCSLRTRTITPSTSIQPINAGEAEFYLAFHLRVGVQELLARQPKHILRGLLLG